MRSGSDAPLANNSYLLMKRWWIIKWLDRRNDPHHSGARDVERRHAYEGNANSLLIW